MEESVYFSYHGLDCHLVKFERTCEVREKGVIEWVEQLHVMYESGPLACVCVR